MAASGPTGNVSRESQNNPVTLVGAIYTQLCRGITVHVCVGRKVEQNVPRWMWDNPWFLVLHVSCKAVESYKMSNWCNFICPYKVIFIKTHVSKNVVVVVVGYRGTFLVGWSIKQSNNSSAKLHKGNKMTAKRHEMTTIIQKKTTERHKMTINDVHQLLSAAGYLE